MEFSQYRQHRCRACNLRCQMVGKDYFGPLGVTPRGDD